MLGTREPIMVHLCWCQMVDYLKIKGDAAAVTPAFIQDLLPTAKWPSSTCLLKQIKYFSQMTESYFPCSSGGVYFLLSEEANFRIFGHKTVIVSKSRCWASLVHFQMKSCHLEFWNDDARPKNIWICSTGFQLSLRESREEYTVSSIRMCNCILKHCTLGKSSKLSK